MNRLLIFGGTTEGREIVESLVNREDISLVVCTATEYGKELLPKGADNLKVIVARLDATDMVTIINREEIDVVVDSTHPYAVIVSDNIRKACAETGRELVRIKRPESTVEGEKVIFVNSAREAAQYLNNTEGNILSTIGSKELGELTEISDYRNRVYARVLSNPEMVLKAYELGYEGRHLICMQGPFSKGLNSAMIKEYDIKYLLTKESGTNGGFLEKCESAIDNDINLVIIGRPDASESGVTVEDFISRW